VTPAAKPPTLQALRDHVAAHGQALTPRQRDAARHALDHPHDVALKPVAQLAAESRIAAAAFIRMAQALGYAGYGELQAVFATALKQAAAPSLRERIRHVGGEQAVDDPADTTALLRAFAQANAASLEHLRDDAAAQPLARAVAMVRKARTVYVLGLRRSFAVAAYLAYALPRAGCPALQITGLGGALAEQARAVRKGDLLLAVSFPPYAADTLAVCEQVHAQGAPRLAITDTVLSPVARGAALVLQVHDAELLGLRSLTSALCLAQTLAMGLAFRNRGGTGTASLQDIDC